LAEDVEVIRADGLVGLPHGFLGRRGGVSTGTIAGLNVGHGAEDDVRAVRENRRRAVTAVLPGARVATVYQVHSPDVVEVLQPWPHTKRPRADAMVTTRRGLLLGVVTADCAPVLFADIEAGVIGAAHAGWRGAHGGVLENTILKMERLGARRERMEAAIGPAIGQESYEVDAAFRDNFGADDERFFAPGVRPGHWQFNLETYIFHRLQRAGLVLVDPLGLDTYSDPERFFSYRRATHRGEPTYGRNSPDRPAAIGGHNRAKMPVGRAGPLVYQPGQAALPGAFRTGAAGQFYLGSVSVEPAGKARQWQPLQAPPIPKRWPLGKACAAAISSTSRPSPRRASAGSRRCFR
jgi:YfiH family protein